MSRITRSEAALIGSAAASARLLAIPLTERIRANVRETENGCWEWAGYRYGNGYSALSWQGKQQLAHRLSYEAFVGPIPEGLVIDHLCLNKGCVNPTHLEPVTSRENTRRAMRSHCINGHPFDDANTWMHRGKRYCRECRRQRNRAWQKAAKK